MATLKQVGTITLGSTAKFFRKGEPTGTSTGSDETLQFEVITEPGEEVTPKQLGRLILEKKREMDERVMVAEYLRGTLTAAELNEKRLTLQARYVKALGLGQEKQT